MDQHAEVIPLRPDVNAAYDRMLRQARQTVTDQGIAETILMLASLQRMAEDGHGPLLFFDEDADARERAWVNGVYLGLRDLAADAEQG